MHFSYPWIQGYMDAICMHRYIFILTGIFMKLQPTKSIGEQVYEYILEKVKLGEYQEGERLTETSMAEELNISRMPVREAFRRLEQDGILEKTPQRGIRVTKITAETISEIFGIRRLLEPYAVELACQNRDETHLAEMRIIEAEALDILGDKETSASQKYKRLLVLNTRFHEVIYRASGSQYLMQLLNNMRDMVLRMRRMGLRQEAEWQQSWKEHAELISLIRSRDGNKAAEKLRFHIDKAAQHTEKEFEQRN